jgi:hypothetical protein
MDDPITARTKRLLQMVEMADKIASNSPYSTVAAKTGLAASKWRDLMRGKTKSVTSEMLSRIAVAWPEYSLWLMCGTCDVQSVDVEMKAAQVANATSGILATLITREQAP